MIKLKDIGDFETIPEILNDIINENISKLDEHLTKGWDIDKVISIGEYIDLSPLDCALIQGCFKSVKWLVEHGVNLNMKDNPSFLTAVRYCDEKIIQYIVSNGAKVNLTNNVKSDAFMEAIYGKNYKYLQLIHDLGHTVEKYGGKAFRNAVSDRNYEVLKFFISNGVDINYNEADMIYPFKPTPLCVAVRYVDLAMCKFLVENGADVTLTEKDGMRPYSIALEKGDIEMAEYFKSLEPVEYHSLQNKLDELKPFKLPKNLIEFLQGEKLHFELNDCDFRWIEFFSLMDTIPMKVGRQKLLRISKIAGDYEHMYIVWNPKTKKIAFYDMEHKELKDITDFVDFINNVSSYMQKIIEGDL
nr:ankyrin repeat domain-containing protein [uncultured Fusobacterium sp.]